MANLRSIVSSPASVCTRPIITRRRRGGAAMSNIVTRRTFLRHATLAGVAAVTPLGWARAAVAQSADGRPAMPFGVQSGDVTPAGGVIWSATDRPARLIVEYATSEGFADVRRVVGAGRAPGDGLHRPGRADRPARRPGRLLPGDASRISAISSPISAPVTGRFKTAASRRPRRDVRLVRRHRRAGVGDQPGVGRDEDLRDDAPAGAGLLRPQRRHDLRRRPDPGRGRAARAAARGATS